MTFDEWFKKEYEPTETYLNDLRQAFEAGLHADVHTDNSKVIADLEEKLANADYQLEGRDVTIKELEAQIEKMKRCGNCKNYKSCSHWCTNREFYRHWNCVCEDWEIKEK